MLLADICFVVYSIFFLETVQTALSGADLYYWFAAGFGNTGSLTAPFASFVDVQMMGSVVSLSVQFFFVYRIWMLSEKRSWLLCVAICLVTSYPKVPERPYLRLIFLPIPIALFYQRVSGVRGGYLCESPLFLITQNLSQSWQSYLSFGFLGESLALKVSEMVKPSNKQDKLPL